MAKRHPAFERLLQNLERDRNEREVRYANEIVGQTGVTRSEALRIARERVARDDPLARDARGDQVSFLDTLYVVRREEAAAFGENLVLRVGQVLDYAVPTKIATYAPISASDGKAAEVWVTALPARFYEVRVRGWSVKFATGSGDEMRALAIALAKAAAEGMISPRNDDEQSEKPA